MCVCTVFAQISDDKQDGGDAQSEPILSRPMGQRPSSVISGSLAEIFAQIQEQDPIRRGGLKASVLRRVQTIIPMVVVVEDADSYLFAISNWEGILRFPVLWDDGSIESHEDIARFVRAFKPKEVVRLNGHVQAPWSGDRTHKQEIFESVLGQAIDGSKLDWKASLDALADTGIVSPGIVVSDVRDTAWPAALALAAGRMQPMVFVDKYKRVNQRLSVEDSDTLEREIERGAQATGRSWKTIGDDIDAITLAINTGTMIQMGESAGGRIATTDRIGRRESQGSGARWAYTGQIIGNESRATYQAMCALFLTIDQAFIWDGYGGGQLWAQYDGTQAGQTLDKVSIETEINDEPKNSLKDWKLRMVRPVGNSDGDAGSSGVFLMNSKGSSIVFDLQGGPEGMGKPGHMPMLNVPMAMHIVHSYSLQFPMNRNTVGGRLLEHGVYVYAGSVDEPLLGGFVPTPLIARRLAGSLAFATAVRFDDGKVWKITVLGDPLVTFGPAGRRTEQVIDVPGGKNLGQRYKERLKASEFEGAIEDLTMLGRDTDAVRIAIALINDKPELCTPGVAMAAIPALFRMGEYTTIVDAYDRLDVDGRANNQMQDILWLSSPYLLARSAGNDAQRSRIFALLRANIRDGQKVHDGEALAMAMRSRSMADALGVLESLRRTLDARDLKLLEKALKRVRR